MAPIAQVDPAGWFVLGALGIAVLTFVASQLSGWRRRLNDRDREITENWRKAAESERALRQAAEATASEREIAIQRLEERSRHLEELLKVEKARPDLSSVMDLLQAQTRTDQERFTQGMAMVAELFDKQGKSLDKQAQVLEQIRLALTRQNGGKP